MPISNELSHSYVALAKANTSESGFFNIVILITTAGLLRAWEGILFNTDEENETASEEKNSGSSGLRLFFANILERCKSSKSKPGAHVDSETAAAAEAYERACDQQVAELRAASAVLAKVHEEQLAALAKINQKLIAAGKAPVQVKKTPADAPQLFLGDGSAAPNTTSEYYQAAQETDEATAKISTAVQGYLLFTQGKVAATEQRSKQPMPGMQGGN